MLHVTPEALDRLRSLQMASETRERKRIEARAKRRLEKLSAGRFAKIVAAVALILKTGRPTMFEHEGACRYGIRRSLVLEGWKWADADAAARSVIHAALLLIGAERPSWMDGQPEAAANMRYDRDYCIRCNDPIPDDRKHQGIAAKYCSALCNSATQMDKQRIMGVRWGRAGYLAVLAERKSQTIMERSGDCKVCGTLFVTDRIGQEFCSVRCAQTDRRVHADAPCGHCGTLFRPRVISASQRLTSYCSQACYLAALPPKVRHPLQCHGCSAYFFGKAPSDRPKYCSKICRMDARRKAANSDFACEEVA